jgi:hypothetical protein
MLFLGKTASSIHLDEAAGGKVVTPGHTNVGTIAEVLQEFSNASIDDQKEMAALLALAGYTSSAVPLNQVNEYVQNSNLPDIIAGYNNLLQDAASRYQNGQGQQISPTQLLQQAIKYRLHAQGIDWNGKLGNLWGKNGLTLQGVGAKQQTVPIDGQTRSHISTQTTRDILDPADAKGLTRAMLQQELGRDPTQAEFEDFVAMLQQATRDNPTHSTTTTQQQYDATTGQWYDTNTSTTSSGGISQTGLQELAQEKAQQNPDWAEWQAVGTYAPALFDALGATVSGVGS